MPVCPGSFGEERSDTDEVKLDPEVLTRDLMDRIPNGRRREKTQAEIERERQRLMEDYRRLYS